MRPRETSEIHGAPYTAKMANRQISQVLEGAEIPLDTMKLGDRTVTVSHPIEGLCDAANEQIRRAKVPTSQRPTLFGGKGID